MATIAVIFAFVVVVAIAGIGVYVFVFAVPNSPGSRTSTVVIGATTSTSRTSGIQGFDNYQGTFTYITPLGPFGINDSSGKPVEWNSTQYASGSFTFSINPANYTGNGIGHGTIKVSTRGYCTGTAVVPYTFTITAVHVPGRIFQIAFNVPTPSSVMVQLRCQGSTMGFNEANNPVTFLSVYPNGLNPASFPATVSQSPTNGISYTVTITQTS